MPFISFTNVAIILSHLQIIPVSITSSISLVEIFCIFGFFHHRFDRNLLLNCTFVHFCLLLHHSQHYGSVMHWDTARMNSNDSLLDINLSRRKKIPLFGTAANLLWGFTLGKSQAAIEGRLSLFHPRGCIKWRLLSQSPIWISSRSEFKLTLVLSKVLRETTFRQQEFLITILTDLCHQEGCFLCGCAFVSLQIRSQRGAAYVNFRDQSSILMNYVRFDPLNFTFLRNTDINSHFSCVDGSFSWFVHVVCHFRKVAKSNFLSHEGSLKCR